MKDASLNFLLAMLPESITQRLGIELGIVAAATGDVLLDTDEPITDLYFPIDLVVSLDQVVGDDAGGDDTSAGVALIGREGFVGIESLFGSDRAINRATVRLGGRAARIRADTALEEFARPGAFRLLLLRSADDLLGQLCGISACERVHPVEQRLIRWLLMFDDRVVETDLKLTQEVLAQLLHVRRVSITVAASVLQLAGLITYTRGTIMIADRAGLEARSCKCYRAIKARYDAARQPD